MSTTTEGKLFNTRAEAASAAKAENARSGFTENGPGLWYFETRDYVHWRKWTVVLGIRNEPVPDLQALDEGELQHTQWRVTATTRSGNIEWQSHFDDTPARREAASRAAEEHVAKGRYVYVDKITRYKFAAPDSDISGFNTRAKS